MIDQLFNNPDSFIKIIATGVTVGVFIYILVLSVLQSRQIRILQDKVKTDADPAVRIFTYIYLAIQIILFVIALLFL